MKIYAKTLLMGSVSLLLLTACGSNNQQSKSTQTDTVKTSQTAEETTATVEFFATGEYEVGIDIQPGSYYAVLTDIQYSSDDEEKSAYVSLYVQDSEEKFKDTPNFKEIGKPYRVKIEVDDTLSILDGYSPSSWTVTFFTSEDYKEYQASEKKSVTASSSSSTSSSPSVEKSSEKETELSPSSSSEDSSTSDSSLETKTEVSSTSSEPVSDSEIESIKTYNDYLDVYGRIVNNYLDNYKAKMDEYGLADEATYAEMKKGVEEGVQQQKEAYGSMGNKKVVGKSDLVKFLKEYRDELQAFVDTVAQSLE